MPQPKTESWLHAGSGPPTVVVGGKGCAPGGIITPVAGTGQSSWQLMGDYVGVVNAPGATISGGTVAGVIVGQAANPPTTKPLPPPSRDP